MEKSLYHYQLCGKKSSPFFLIFLHGFMGCGSDWNPITEQISSKAQCFVVDLPGHGKTVRLPEPSNYSIEQTASHLIQIWDKLKIHKKKKCILVGYSMGGRLALYLALHYPHYFSGLILESASPGLKTDLEREARRKQDEVLAQKLETTKIQLFLENWYNLPLFQSLKKHPNFLPMFQKREENQPTELAKSLRNMGTGIQTSLWSKWPEISIPTLLLVGEKDTKFYKIGKEMVEKSPKAKLNIIPQTGHNIHLENETDFVLSIKRFLNELSNQGEIE